MLLMRLFSMQIFRNCADITLVGDDTATPPSNPAPSPPPAPIVESVPEEMPPPEIIEEGDPPMGMGGPPQRGPPQSVRPMAARLEERPSMGATPPMMDAVLFDLAVVDVGNNFETLFVDMHTVTITVADYPYGFGIRALVEDSSQVQTVTFTTSEGYTHTEYHENYDMFTRRAGYFWPAPSVGAHTHTSWQFYKLL